MDRDDDSTAIVELDCISSLGVDLTGTWQCLIRNESGLRKIERYDPASQRLLRGLDKIAYAAEVQVFPADGLAEEFWRDRASWAVRLLVRRVLNRLQFAISQHDPQRIAILGATAFSWNEPTERLLENHKASAKYILTQCPNVPLSEAAAEFDLRGPSFSVAAACASSAHAVLIASYFLKARALDCAVIVGYDFPVTPVSVAAMNWIKALYRRELPSDRAFHDPSCASRPFSRDRRGLVLGEGAGILVLTRQSYAQKMDWPIYALLEGGYANSDAQHPTRLCVENVAQCMRGALRAACCDESHIACVSAHATSTVQGDAAELLALQDVLGYRLAQVAVTANKSQLGHTLGAAGILAVVLSVKSMCANLVLPVLNHVRDEDLPLALVSRTCRELAHSRVLVNAFGFGGTNVSLILQRA